MKLSKLYFFSFVFALGVVAQIFINFSQTNSDYLTTEQSSLGIINPDYVDNKNNSIQVCWGDLGLMKKSIEKELAEFIQLESVREMIDDNLKAQVQIKVQEQYNLEKVGIQFVGWENCTSKDKSSVQIFAFKKLSQEQMTYEPGICSVGNSMEVYNKKTRKRVLIKRPKNIPNAMFLKMYEEDPNKIQIFMRTAVHEFGHAAGLHHEHFQKEAASDPNCQDFKKQDPNFNVPYLNIGKVISYNAYDPNSIMNSCFIMAQDNKQNQKIEDIQLSPSDIQTLRCTYSREKLKSEDCIRRQVSVPVYEPQYDDEGY